MRKSFPIGVTAGLLLSALLIAPAASGQQTVQQTGPTETPRDDGDVAEVRACIEKNIPVKASQQIVEFVSVDRVGGERVARAKILAKRLDDGLRRVLTRITKPLDMRGSNLLVIETTRGANDMFLYSPEIRKVKRVTAEQSGGSLFGTDFSYEDFQRWQLLNKPGRQKRLEDNVVADRPVYVLSVEPGAEEGSAYEMIVSFVDKETCVVLKTESYEQGARLRKVFTAAPESIIEEGSVYVASEVVMTDVRDETHTNATIEDLEVDRDIPDREFTISQLSKRR